MREVIVTSRALADLLWWTKTSSRTATRILKLIQEAQKTPFEGIGKPEPLRHELSGCWSRRIDKEHRLVYEVEADRIRVLACRLHYGG